MKIVLKTEILSEKKNTILHY